MNQAASTGAVPPANEAGEQSQTSSATKPKRLKRVKPSPAMEQVTQHLTQAGVPDTSTPARVDAIESFRIGFPLSSLELPEARNRRPLVRSGFAISYDTNQS